MLTPHVLLSVMLVSPQPQAESVLHCYGYATQIGTFARREFRDDKGFVYKEIYYTSTEAETSRGLQSSCKEENLRVQSVRTYEREATGALIERLGPKGIGEYWRVEFEQDGQRTSVRTLHGPKGERRYQIRYRDGSDLVHLYFDDNERLVGVRGQLPTDVTWGFEWGPETDGWSCGVALGSLDGSTIPTINLHVRNNSHPPVSVQFARWFESDLRDEQGRIVPLTPRFESELASMQGTSGTRYTVHSGAAAFYGHSLEQRYGRLPPGRYSLVVRHPHPTSRVMLVSNTLTFEVPSHRHQR